MFNGKIKILYWVAFVIILVYVFTLFNITGSEIAGIDNISADNTVTIRYFQKMDNPAHQEFQLDNSQKEALYQLFTDTSFVKADKDLEYREAEGQDRFDIIVESAEGQELLFITCIDGRYILVKDQFDGRLLNIKNSIWKESAEGIFFS